MNNEMIEKVINQVYPGLTHYVRDTNLEEKIINKYNAGRILYERAFVDTTNKIGKPIKKVRFSIFSNNAVELNAITDPEHQNNWGLHLINKDSAFKVLDVYSYEEKILITLLHIPIEYDSIFEKVNSNLDDQIIETARKRFETSMTQDIKEELDEEWYKRVQFPIGMTDDGEYFSKN